MSRILLVIVSAYLFTACTVDDVPSTTEAGFGTTEGALAGGCRTICPKCHPGAVCSTAMCYQECEGKAKTCDIMAKCMAGYTWSDKKCTCVIDKKAESGCATDADCRVYDDYCTGCDCRALSQTEADPLCDGPGVRCFAQPCLNKIAVCVAGTCTVESGSVL